MCAFLEVEAALELVHCVKSGGVFIAGDQPRPHSIASPRGTYRDFTCSHLLLVVTKISRAAKSRHTDKGSFPGDRTNKIANNRVRRKMSDGLSFSESILRVRRFPFVIV